MSFWKGFLRRFFSLQIATQVPIQVWFLTYAWWPTLLGALGGVLAGRGVYRLPIWEQRPRPKPWPSTSHIANLTTAQKNISMSRSLIASSASFSPSPLVSSMVLQTSPPLSPLPEEELVVEPIIAVRMFSGSPYSIARYPETEGLLLSPLVVGRSIRYEVGGEYTATCYSEQFVVRCAYPPMGHVAPHPHCACGFWGLKPGLELLIAGYSFDMVGVVAFSGRVIQHKLGYRAEKMLVLEALHPSSFAELEKAAERAKEHVGKHGFVPYEKKKEKRRW